MRKITISLAAAVGLLGLPAFVAQQNIGYDQSSAAACMYDRAAAPNCVPPEVASKAALASISINPSWAGKAVRRLGYAAAGDGGDAIYVYSTVACSLNSGAGDGGLQVKPAGGSGCWTATIPSGGADIRLWGAQTTDADISTALGSAITAAASAGQPVRIPAGSWRLTNTVTASSGHIRIMGAGVGQTQILSSLASADTIVFSGTCSDCGISDLSITATATTRTGGCLVKSSNGAGNTRVERLRIEHGYDGVCMSNSPVTGVLTTAEIDFAHIVHDAVVIDGASQWFGRDLTVYTAGGAAYRLIDAGGCYLSNVTGGLSDYGLLIAPPTGKSVFDCQISNFEADMTNTAGISIDSSNGGKIWDIRLNNIRSGYSSGPGISFGGNNTTNIDLSNFTTNRNSHEGIVISGLKYSSISNGQVIGNSSVAPGYNGINIAGGDQITISGLHVSAAYPGQIASNQAYGLAVQSGFSGALNVHDNDLTGNVTGAFANGSGSTTISLVRNRGYNPRGVLYPTPPSSGATWTNGVSPSTVVLSGGTCSAVSIGAVALPSQCSNAVFHLEPGQGFAMTYTAVPNFYLITE